MSDLEYIYYSTTLERIEAQIQQNIDAYNNSMMQLWQIVLPVFFLMVLLSAISSFIVWWLTNDK